MEKWINIGRVSAFLAPLFFVLFTALAVMSYPEYNVHKNFLSDLGVGPNSALFFNTGAVLAGLFAVVLAISLNKIFHKDPSCKLGSLFLLFGGAFLMGIGTFTENTGTLHSIIAIIFFSCLSLTLLSFANGLRKKTKLSYFFLLCGIAIPILFFFGVTALVEHIAVGLLVLWSMGVSLFLKGLE